MAENDTEHATRAYATYSKRAIFLRILRVLVWLISGLLVLGLASLVALRLYFDDARLKAILSKTLSERFAADVRIAELELHVFSGVRVGGLEIDPPLGFREPPLRVKEAELRYDPFALFGGEVRVPRLVVSGVSVAVETRSDGRRNVDVLLQTGKSNTGASTPSPEPAPPERAVDEPVALPKLPFSVNVEDVRITQVDLTWVDPLRRIRLDRIRTQARLRGRDDFYAGLFEFGLGPERPVQPAPTEATQSAQDWLDGPSSELNYFDVESAQDVVRASQKFNVRLVFNGLDDLELTVRLGVTLDPEHPVDSPPISGTLALDAKGDLLKQSLRVERFDFQLGDDTRLMGQVQAHSFVREPKVELAAWNFETKLDALEPMLRGLDSTLRVSGLVSLQTKPMTLQTGDWLGTISGGAEAHLKDVSIRWKTHGIDSLRADVAAGLAPDTTTVTADLSAARVRSGAVAFSGLRLSLDSESASAPWTGRSKAGKASATLRLGLDSAVLPGARLQGVSSRLKLHGPVSVLKGGERDVPLRFAITSRISELALGDHRLKKLQLETEGGLYDLRGNRLRLDELSFRVGERLDLRAKLDARDLLTGIPRIHSAELYLAPLPLSDSMALIPPKLRPEFRMEGTLEVDAEIAGRIPIDALQRSMTPAEGGERLSAGLERVSSLLERGLPFRGHVGVELNNVTIENSAASVKGFSVDCDLNILEDGPRVELAMLLGRLEQPVSLHDLRFNTTLAFHRRKILTEAFLNLGRLQSSFFPKDVKNASLEWHAEYEVGGALLLDKLEWLAPDRDGRVFATLRVQNPLRVLNRRSFALAGMPGVEVLATLDAGIRIDSQAPVRVPGFEVQGGLNTNLRLRASDGIVSGDGAFSLHDLSIEHPVARLTRVDGSFPLQISIATREATGYVALPQRVPFGDGRLRVKIDSKSGVAGARPAYFPRIRRYRSARGLRADRILVRGFEIKHFEIEGAVRDARFDAERARLSILGGDIDGSMSIGLSGERAVTGRADLKLSNLDASYFAALDLEPGPSSEVDADATFGFDLSPNRRDLSATMNVTRISTTGLDRLLQLLDPAEENRAIQSTRFYLNLAQIKGVAMWLAYENFNVDLDANSVIKIPFTDIGVPSFERELLRRESMSNYLDLYWDPVARTAFGPLIGG